MNQKSKKLTYVMMVFTALFVFALSGCSDNDHESSTPSSSEALILSDFQAASVVIGQPDFTSGDQNQGGSADADTFSGIYGNPVVHNDILYLPDYGNSRVLGFNTIPTTNGESADFVLGQPDFTTTDNFLTQAGMDGPQSVSVDDDKFFLTDYSYGRITIYNTVPTAGPGLPDVVVGQPDFVTQNEDSDNSGLSSPETSIAVDGKLIVTDSGNNRVLIWNSIPTANGAPADIVLGQSDLMHTSANDDNQDDIVDSNPTARTLSTPCGVWSDGTKIVVLDNDNSRALIWNTFPTANFTPADVVLGQGDFSHYAENDDDQDGVADGTPSDRTLNYPYDGVYSKSDQLFIADYDNNRVLVWNTFPTTNFAPADVVLGQADFNSNMENDADNDGIADATPSATTLYEPKGFYVEGNKLIVADGGNYRYLIYEGQ